MRNLWLTMAAFYGAKWVSANGDVFGESGPMGEAWRAALAGVTPAELSNGFRALKDREDPWPPGAIEFAQLCKPDPIDHSKDWMANKPRTSMMLSPERLQWHKDNIAHVKAGGELPRDVPEPPGPVGGRSFRSVYREVVGP